MDGKEGFFYTRKELADNSVLRDLMTRMEHQRWNAYMISCGYVPTLMSEYEKMGKLNLEQVRKHVNIVTFEELINQREALAKIFGCSIEDADVIKYDYRMADNLPELLKLANMKIIERQEKSQEAERKE